MRPVHPRPGNQNPEAVGAPGILVVVDYADRWPLPHLTWPFSMPYALLNRPGVPTRVLLVGRT